MTHKLTPEQIEQGWVLHDLKKGEQPVDDDVLVSLQFPDGDITQFYRRADVYRWNCEGGEGDIVAYCVVDEKGNPVKSTSVTESEPKYSIQQLRDYYNNSEDAPCSLFSFLDHFEAHMEKQNNPEYQKYLELKAKFES